MDFKAFMIEGGFFTDGKESEDAKRWYKKDPRFGDMARKPGPGGPKGMGGGDTSMGPGTTMLMKKKMKKKQKKS